MSRTTTNIESLAWMAEVGVPPEDVQYLKSMSAYGGLRIESVRVRVKEIQEQAYERLLAVSMLPPRTPALTQ